MTSTPTVIRLTTARPTSLNSSNRSVSPPSNRMMPTESDANVSTQSPPRASGGMNPVTGPARNPNPRRSRIEGNLVRQASH